MRRRLFFFALLLALLTVLASSQQLTVQTEAGKQTVLTRSDIDALPHVKVVAGSANMAATFEGIPLKAVLEKAGVTLGETLKGKRMASCLLVEAADDYHVVIALPELDPAFTDKQIVLAFARDGKPLDAKEGPCLLYTSRCV